MGLFENIKTRRINKIIKKQDAKALLGLSDDASVDFLITLTHDYFYEIPLDELNNEQRTVFLCMAFDETCQADGILSLTEDENVFFSLYETYNALLSIGAAKTADELKRFIELMPENTFEERIMPEWDWFFADSEREKLIKEIDSAASGYLDGLISDLLWSYCISDIETAKKVLDINL